MTGVGVWPGGDQPAVRADDHFERERLAKGPASEEGARPDEGEPGEETRVQIVKEFRETIGVGGRHGGCRGAKSVYDVC